jgi:RNA polymerase sigma factor (sigma-70 family)
METPTVFSRVHAPEADRNLVRFLEHAAQEVHRWYPRVEVSDLIQAGEVRLLEIRPRFDPSRGASLTTFAYRPVRAAMRRFARRETTRAPLNSPKTTSPSPEDLAVAAEQDRLRLDALQRGIARLDPLDAELLLRVDGAGERVSTVAHVLGLDYDAARYRLRLGRERLAREVLRGEVDARSPR